MAGAKGARHSTSKIDVDAAKVVEHEVADGVGALDGMGVGEKGGKEPGVVVLQNTWQWKA